MRIIILGAPGTGKRAQTQRLAEKYGIESLTTGELVKRAMTEPGGYGPQVKMLHAAGQHISDDLLLNLLQERLRRPEMGSGFVLNGFPRNLLQALTLDESLAELDQPLDLVILLHIETDALMERLVGRRTCRSCGAQFNIYTHPAVVEGVCDHCGGRLHQRADDNEETVSSRLHVFEHLTHALLDHYGKQEKLLQVDGEGSAEQVFERVCQGMDGFLNDRSLETKQANTESVAAVAEAEPSYEVENSNSETADTTQTATSNVKAKSSSVAKKKASPKKAASSAPSKSKKAAAKKKAVVKSAKKSKPKVQKKAAVKKKPAVKKPSAKPAATKKKHAKTKVSAKKKVTQKKKVAKKKVAKKLLSKKKKPISSVKKKVAKKRVAVSKKKVAVKKKVSAKKKTVAKKRIATKKASVAKKSATKKRPPRPTKKVAKKKIAQAKRPTKSVAKKTQKKKPVKKAAVAKSAKKSKKKSVSRKKSARR
jgi:adenylate kinase